MEHPGERGRMLPFPVKPMLVTIALIFLTFSPGEARVAIRKKVERIAFGSCNKHDYAQPAWESISKAHPDIFLWTGDVVYADNKHPWFRWQWHQEEDPSEIQRRYTAQKNRPEYSSFLKANPNMTVLGIWDDHDYGVNNGDKTNKFKDTVMRDVFLDFLDEAKDSPRRKPGRGLYESYVFQGPKKSQRIKIILLDVRYDKTDETLLGKDQWAWLGEELVHSRSENIPSTFIVSGIQVLAGIGRPPGVGEGWIRYLDERSRIQQLISRSRTPGVVFVSGDVHFGELTLAKCVPTSYHLWEITSSGLTHAWGFDTRIPMWLLETLFYFLSPEHNRYGDLYLHRNWGSIDIDWSQPKNASLTLNIHDVPSGDVVRTASLHLGNMEGDQGPKPECDELNHSFQRAKPRLIFMMLCVCCMALSSLVFVCYVLYRIGMGVFWGIAAVVRAGGKKAPPRSAAPSKGGKQKAD